MLNVTGMLSSIDQEMLGDIKLVDTLKEVVCDDLFNKYEKLIKENLLEGKEEQINIYKAIKEDTNEDMFMFEIRFEGFKDSLFLQAHIEQMKVLPGSVLVREEE